MRLLTEIRLLSDLLAVKFIIISVFTWAIIDSQSFLIISGCALDRDVLVDKISVKIVSFLISQSKVVLFIVAINIAVVNLFFT